MIVAILSLTGIFWSHLSWESPQVESLQTDSVVLPQQANFYGFPLTEMRVVEGKIKRNQRFIDVLKEGTVSAEIIRQITLLPREIFDFKKIVVNKPYSLLLHADSLNRNRIKALVYEPDPLSYVLFHLEDTLIVEACRHTVTKKEKTIAGIIESSLFETIEALQIPYVIVNQLVDIFAWQIDFQKLRKGDVFKIVYEEYYVKNKPIKLATIKDSYFNHRGTGYCAFLFRQDQKSNYYDESGHSLQKALLKYPIEFTRISSRYSRRRRHPVTKIFKAHLGTDFVAPKGTPIRSVGDGVVVEAKYTLYNGNYVKIRHNDVYTTQYLHMSNIAKGIRRGTKVHRKQKIGYVGRTGLATGNHLCYRFWKWGNQVDALAVQLPPSESIKKEKKKIFLDSLKHAVETLNTISFPDV